MPHLARSTWIAIAALLTTAGAAGAQPTVEYDWSGGGLRGIPLVPGRTYQLEIQNRNTLCYAYQAEVAVRESSANLGAMVTALGYTQGTKDGAAPAVVPPPAPPALPPPPPAMIMPPVVPPAAGAVTVAQARRAVTEARSAVAALDETRKTVTNLVGRIEQPVCTGRSPVQPLLNDWDALAGERNTASAWRYRLDNAQDLADRAQTAANALPAGAVKNDLLKDLESPYKTLEDLATQLPSLASRLASAEGKIETAREGVTVPTSVFIPAGASGADLTIRATELNPKDGKTATVIENKVPLPLRRGMRVFLSVGVLGSTVSAHDYARSNRVYGDTAVGKRDSTYSTYIDRAGGRGLGFAPVLQTNLAFRDFLSTGASFHTSLGVASRSVNGRVSPEFIFGAGTGFLDHFLITVGYHLSRNERLLLGSPAAVAQRPVPTTVTDADAVGEIWQSAVAMTVTLKL